MIYHNIKEFIMEAAKCQNQYKYDHFEISLTAFSEKKLSLTVFDKF